MPVRIVTVPMRDARCARTRPGGARPTGQAEVGPDHQPDAHPEEDQPEEQPREPSPQLVGGRERAAPRHATAPGCSIPPRVSRYRRTRIAGPRSVAPSSPLSLSSTSTPWVAPVSFGELELAGEVAEHAVAAAGDEGLADRLLHAVDVEADVHRALEGVGLALERLRRA